MQPESDRPLQARERLALAGSLVLIVLAAGTCGACLDHFTPALAATRTPQEWHQSSVEIRTTCLAPNPDALHTGSPEEDELLNSFLFPDVEEHYRGTGVLLTTNRLLTNVHVVDCAAEGMKFKSVTVDIGDGLTRDAVVEVLLPINDIARLWLKKPIEYSVTPPEIGAAPQIGDRLCFAAAVPQYGYRCGEMQPSPKGAIYVDSLVQHGNSGAAAVDSDGRIIGLVRATMACEQGVYCVGAITPITDDLTWLVRP